MRTLAILMVAAFAATFASSQRAEAAPAPVDVDIVFVIDSSVSMGGEFDFLGGAIAGFLADLQADARIATAQAGLITYEDSPVLQQDLTGDASALQAAFNSVSVSGGTENAFVAVDSGMPGGNVDFNLSFRQNSVRSIILITDEDSDDSDTYSNAFATGDPIDDLNALLDLTGFLVNIIYEFRDFAPEYGQIARPATGLFDITAFRNDRQKFFEEFTATKIQELTTPSEIPLPAALPLFIAGMGALGFAKTRRKKSA